MRKVTEIHTQETAMSTLVELTSIFEGLASMRIAKIKDQVLQSSKFFEELWSIYSQIKVSEEFKFGREESDTTILDKELLVIVTAEGSFSGDIDQKLVRLMQKDYFKDKNDVIVIGHHGAMQLAQAGISYTKYYKMPQRDLDINVTPIVQEIRKYRSTKVYYQEYVSLMVQDVRRIDLSHAVNMRGEENKTKEDNIIDEKSYIFEPSTYAVVAHLERSMMQITISQLILESKLAQYASRFQAMRASNDRASETRNDLKIEFNRAKRAIKDERLKEIINGLKKSQVRTVG